MLSNFESLGVSRDGGGLSWREESWPWDDSQVCVQTACASVALGADVRQEEKELVEGGGNTPARPPMPWGTGSQLPLG